MMQVIRNADGQYDVKTGSLIEVPDATEAGRVK